MWLDKEELFSNKNPHIVVWFRNKVASAAGDVLDGDGQPSIKRVSALQTQGWECYGWTGLKQAVNMC